MDLSGSDGESGSFIQEDFNFKLINCIKKHPVIYAKASKVFRNAGKKDKSWQDVAKEMGVSETEAKRKWKHIRDRYVKEHRKVSKTSASGAGSDEVYTCKWPLYDELHFLESHCESRSTSGNYRMPETQPLPAEDEPLSSEPFLEECFVQEPLGTQEQNETLNETEIEGRQSKRRKVDPIDDRINTILDKVEDMVSVPQGVQGRRHEAFAHYLTSHLEMLPLSVARDLEVEFTCRVNAILDLQIEQI